MGCSVSDSVWWTPPLPLIVESGVLDSRKASAQDAEATITPSTRRPNPVKVQRMEAILVVSGPGWTCTAGSWWWPLYLLKGAKRWKSLLGLDMGARRHNSRFLLVQARLASRLTADRVLLLTSP